MDLEFPESRCELSPNHAHFYTVLTGGIWRCKYCWVTKWLPSYWEDASRFGLDIRKYGIDKAYQRLLRHRPQVRDLLGKLEKIRLLRKVLSEEELMIAIAATMTDKEEKDERIAEKIQG